ncbi:MAG: hypothetical protein AAGE52_29950 [Myxococcota bacterium]
MDVQTFLRLFVDSFALSRTNAFAFSPDDKVWDIYDAQQRWNLGDMLQLEWFQHELERVYGLRESFENRDVTLADLFRAAS